MQATITAAYINPPKRVGLSASIKDTSGKFWGFRENELKFEAGKTYTVEYEESQGKDGRTYANVTKILKASAGSNGGDRWYMPFVSNTVAHAIAAGRIDDASQIYVWAKAAKVAAMRLDEIDDVETYDDETTSPF